MKKRTLGKSSLQVSPLCFGGNVFGWTADEKTSFKLLDAFVDAGFNFIDTADVYSVWMPGHQGGESETIIGNWLHNSPHRSKVIIATKVGMQMGNGKKGLSKNHIIESVDASLKRLKTDYIDLYQSHEDDPSVPLEETLSAYADLIQQGKVKYIGASNYTAPRLQEALKVAEKNNLPRYQSLQPLYNLAEREFEKDLQALCVKENLGVISYFSLASGFLTGKYRSNEDLKGKTRGGRVEKYMNERGMKILSALDQVADQHKSTQARVALAWLMTRPSVVSPIVSATNLDQLDDILRATDLSLNSKDIELLNSASQ
jgi:Predicted oxidoreductases (related to aryl-alcohol dehydrogenases)